MKGKIFFLFILFSCLLHAAIAQHIYPKPFASINVADGLPQSFVSGLIQDSTGFIWIGTRDGLAKYDGRKFKFFRHVPGDSASLSDNVINALYLDTEQRLWIFYEAGYTDVLNTVTEKVFHLTKSSPYKQLFTLLKSANTFAEDANHNVWLVGSDSYGIYICNPDKHTLHYYSVTDLGLLNNRIICIKSFNKNIVCITDNSIVTFNSNRQKIKTAAYKFADNLDDALFTWKTLPLEIRPDGEMVIVALGKLVIYSLLNNSFTSLPLPPNEKQTNFTVTQDANEQVYFEYGFNVYVLSLQNKLSIWKPKVENPAYGFKSMLIDKSGVFWLGGNGSGIQLYDMRLPRLSGFPYKLSFHQDVLLNFLQVPQYDLQKTNLNSSQSYYIRWTKGLHKDLWLTTAGDGTVNNLKIYHYTNGRFESTGWHYTDTVLSRHEKINGLAMSPSGELWGIDFHLRPVYFNTITHAVTVYPPIAHVNTDFSFTVSSLVIDKDGKFWISTPLNGLFLYDKPNKKLVHYTAGEANDSLPTNQLMNIVQDAKNADVLWIGSMGGGLIKFNKSTGRSATYTTKQGLPNNTVYAVIVDAKGNLWCSSNKGVFSFNPETHEIRSYTSKDGLFDDEFNRYHFLQLPDGRISFGGIDGYTVFNPLTLSTDNFHPDIAITSIQINNITSDFGNSDSQFKQAVNSLHQIKLNYQQNFLKFEFAALEYNNPDRLKYRYILQGFDKDWIYTGNNNEAVYTKLPPGNYTFKVSATNTAGEWSSYIKTLSIIISPPFWQTWWFIFLLVIAVAGIAYLLIQSRINYIRKEERQKIKFEQEASGLKAQALRAQMNPHFVFNCLNSIKALIQEDKKKEAVIYLTTFSKLIRSQLNNAEQEVSLHDELETCKLYAQLEALRFGDKIITEFKVDTSLDIFSLKVPPLLLQPFIENAIWHGILPKQSGKVIVSVTGENGSINCLIDDNGIGREMAMQNKVRASSTYESKGMGLVKTRLTMYNNISANKASIEVIDKKENNKPAGTLVILKFKPEA